MADVTNYPEMTDELLQQYIARAMQQAMKPEDTSSPLTSGLLAAGLGMMAGSRGRNFGEALGQGGLLGLQAYGAQKEAQKKDPMQMINLLTAVEGLKEKQQGAQWLKNFSGATAAPAQYAMGSDFAPGDAPGPVTPPMQPQMVAPPTVRTAQGGQMGPEGLLGGIGLPGRAGKLSELLYKQAMEPPFKAGPGDTVFNRNFYTGALTQGPTMANLDKNLEIGPDGNVRPLTGVTKSIAEITQAQKDAEEAAKAKQDVIQVTEAGRTRNVNRAQWLAEQQQKLQGVPPDFIAAFQDHMKNTPTQPFTYIPKPQQAALNPTAAEQAIAIKAGEAPISAESKYQEGLITQNLKLRESILADATAARANSANIDRFMQLNKDPNVAKGRFAETFSGLKNAAASFGVDVKGLPAEQAMQSISSQMALQLRNPASGGGMPGAMSDSDRNFLTSMTPALAQSKEGRELVAETFQAVNNRNVEVSRMLLKHEMDGGKVDSAFLKKLADHADKNPIFGEEQQKKLAQIMEAPTSPPAAPKVTGMTRNYHIDNIIKNGSPEDIQKLRDRGLIQ